MLFCDDQQVCELFFSTTLSLTQSSCGRVIVCESEAECLTCVLVIRVEKTHTVHGAQSRASYTFTRGNTPHHLTALFITNTQSEL